MKITSLIEKYYKKTGERSQKAVKNIFYGFGIKGVAILVQILMVPLMLRLLGEVVYGVWLTLYSIITWFNFFDLGFGHGLRNRLAESFARNDRNDAQELVSTTYFVLGIISVIILVIMLIVIPIVNWQSLLNTNFVSNSELNIILIFISISFSANLSFKVINSILLADQRPALSDGILQFSSLFSLIVIFILPFFIKVSLLLLAFILCFSPVLFYMIATLYFFYVGDYVKLRPNLKFVNSAKIRSIFSLGSKFFISQLSSVILFSSINFIIAQVSSPKEVTYYNIVMRYFSIPLIIFGVSLSPFWSAVTDAIAKNEFKWIKKSLKTFLYITLIIAFGIIVLLMISPMFFSFWLGQEIEIPLGLSIIVALSTIVRAINSPFSTFLNGFGKLKLGVIIVIIKDILYLPLAFILGGIWGVIGVVVAMLLMQIVSLIIEPIQLNKLINHEAYGIWGK